MSSSPVQHAAPHTCSATSSEVDLVVDGQRAKLVRDPAAAWPAGLHQADIERFGRPEVRTGRPGWAYLYYRRPRQQTTPDVRPDTAEETAERARRAAAGQNLSDEQWLLFRDWPGRNPETGGAA